MVAIDGMLHRGFVTSQLALTEVGSQQIAAVGTHSSTASYQKLRTVATDSFYHASRLIGTFSAFLGSSLPEICPWKMHRPPQVLDSLLVASLLLAGTVKGPIKAPLSTGFALVLLSRPFARETVQAHDRLKT